MGDSNQEEDQNILDDYGSSYNTTLMKISHSDLQKHAVAVTMPVVPPAISQVSQNRYSSPESEEQVTENNLENSSGSGGFTHHQDRPYVSPYHSAIEEPTQNAAAATGKSTEVNPLSLSNPIARAYRQHLMTKMEESKKVGVGGSGSGHLSNAATLPGVYHRELSYTRSWDPGNVAVTVVKPSTVAMVGNAVSSSGKIDYHNIAKEYSASSSDIDSNQTASDAEYNETSKHGVGVAVQQKKSLQSADGGIRSGSPSILETVRFFEKAQTIAQGQGSSYSSTMPRSRTYSCHDSSVKHGTSQWKQNKAKSIDNLSSTDLSEELESPPPSALMHQGFSPDPMQNENAPYYGTKSHVTPTGEGWASNSLNVGHSSSSCSSSVGSSPSPHAQQLHFPQQSNFTDGASIPPPIATKTPTGFAKEISAMKEQLSSKLKYARPKGQTTPSQLASNLYQAPDAVNVDAARIEGRLKERKLKENEFSLYDYISFYGAQLPRRVKITRALGKDLNKPTLSTGDVLDLHFVRKMKVIEAVDREGMPFVIPMNSASKMSMLYDPFENEKMAHLGFTFDTVAAIMDLKVPPAVVAAKSAVQGENQNGNLVKGEVLVIHGTVTSFHGRLLKVMSLSSRTVKHLDENCDAGFTTDPALLKLSPADIYEQSIPLPQKAIINIHGENAEDAIGAEITIVVRMTKLSIRKSVVATSVLNQRATTKSSLIEVSASVDVHIEEVPSLEEQRKVAVQVTQNLINSSAYKYAVPYYDLPNPTLHSAQHMYLKKVDKKSPYSADILPPRDIFLPPPAKKENKAFAVIPQIEKWSESPQHSSEKELKDVEQKYASLEVTVSAMQSRLEEACKKINKVFNYLNKAQTAMNQHKRLLSSQTEEPPKGRPSSTGKSFISSDSITAITDENKSKSLSKNRSAILQKAHSCSSSVEDNDEVFVVKIPKPPLLPKPKVLSSKRPDSPDKNHNQYSKLAIRRADSGSLSTSKNGSDRDSRSSSRISNSSSTQQSVDLTEVLPAVAGETNNVTPAESKLSKAQEKDAITSINGELDIANWCSQIEDELTQLYNESIIPS